MSENYEMKKLAGASSRACLNACAARWEAIFRREGEIKEGKKVSGSIIIPHHKKTHMQ